MKSQRSSCLPHAAHGRRSTQAAAVVCWLGMAIAFLSGCAVDELFSVAYQFQRPVDPTLAEELAELKYPAEAEYGEDLNVRVIRDRTLAQLINVEPQTISNKQLWVNQQWVRQVERIEVGANEPFALVTMINEHGEPFPVGRWLQPEIGQELNSAELYDLNTGLRHRLTVQPVVDLTAYEQ